MNKYPVSREVCAGCTSCCLVTETITGRHIPESEQYYQCISDMESECVPEQMEDTYDPFHMDEMIAEEKEWIARHHGGALGVDEYIGY